MIDESLATQVMKIISATVTEFGTNANLSRFFITRQELQGIMQGFAKELTSDRSRHATSVYTR